MAMTRRTLWAAMMLIAMAMTALSLVAQSVAQDGSSRGTLLFLNDAVTPPLASYLEREISAASARGDELILIEIDTPGGLVTSMETIVKAMRGSTTPVVTFVAPEGARALSAGFYILYGSHVAVMAPSTTTGAATPISIGGDQEEPSSPFPFPQPTEEEGTDEASDEGETSTADDNALPADLSSEASSRRKVIEASVAYIRGLAVETGRNEDFAIRAVRNGDSITAREALDQGVVELVASSREELLELLDGRVVTTRAGEQTISTTGLTLIEVEPTLVETILKFIADPNVAAILFSLGSVGLIAEIWNPGSIFPGVFGALCLVLAFYSFQVLPANGLFLALMGLGIMLILFEAFTPAFGIMGLSGLALFGVGLFFLYPEEFRVDEAVLFGAMAISGTLLATILFAIAGSRGHGPLIGQEAIKRREGRVDEWDNSTGEGYVIVDGERWRARSKEPLSPNDRIKVHDMDGIILTVRKAAASQSTVSKVLSIGGLRPRT